MKEIKLKNGLDFIKKATVEEEKVEFINGIGVADAIFDTSYNQCYQRSVLIDENFNEICPTNNVKLKETLSYTCPSVLSVKKNIIRVGENDFLVTIKWDQCDFFSHIRLENDKFILVNNEEYMGDITFTNVPYLIIYKELEKKLYNALKGEFVTPLLKDIIVLKNNSNVFLCKTVIRLDGIQDELYFKINEDGNIVSLILSSFDGKYLVNESSQKSIREFVINREKQLKEELNRKQINFENEVENFKNSEEYLEPYQRKLEKIK